jgi:sugar phosphate isomerase/epimerase
VTTRRGFLGASLAALAAHGYRFRPSAPARETDPPSDRLDTIGVQLYTVRGEMRRDPEGTLARVARIGYREVEFAGYHNRTPEQLRDALRANGLSAPAAHVGLDSLEGDRGARTIDAAATLGHRYLVVAWMPEDWRRTLDDWRRVAERMNRVGERTRAAGIQFAYHNHDFEFRPLEGRVPFEVFCEAADPTLVQIELDLFWITHGGGDPLAFIGRWPGRVPMVHVKDRTVEGTMVDVGAGAINWRRIFAERRRAGIRHYFVEHDEPPDPWASISASFGYLGRLEV